MTLDCQQQAENPAMTKNLLKEIIDITRSRRSNSFSKRNIVMKHLNINPSLSFFSIGKGKANLGTYSYMMLSD